MTTPENRLATGRDNVGRFVEGVTGNPGGRPKGLAAYVRSLTGADGEELVDRVWYLLNHPKGKGLQAQRFQLECIQWLSDRGFGKPIQGVVYAGATAQDWDAFKGWSDEDVQMIVDAARAIRDSKANVIEGEAHMLKPGPDAGGEAT